MSEEFFRNFDGSAGPPGPPPPASTVHRRPAAGAAAAARPPAASAAGPAGTPTRPGRPLSAAGPRPMGTNAAATAGAAAAAAAAPTNLQQRQQLQQTRATRPRPPAPAATTTTHLSAPAGAVGNPTRSAGGFYQQQPSSSAPAAAASSWQDASQMGQAALHRPPQQPSTSTAAVSMQQAPAGQRLSTTATQPYPTSSYTQPQTVSQAPRSVGAPQYGMNPTSTDFSGWMNTSGSDTFSGTMDSGATSMAAVPAQPAVATSVFNPNLVSANAMTASISNSSMNTMFSNDDLMDEPPLLEELGINMAHILFKTKAVVLPFTRLPFTKASATQHQQHHHDVAASSIIIKDADLAGPLVFALLLGAELLVTGKIHSFGQIYGLSLFGSLGLTFILNLMKGPLGHAYDSDDAAKPDATAISVWTTTSILGYALLPVNVLAGAKIVFAMLLLQHTAVVVRLLRALGVLTVVWSTAASTRLLEVGCGMRHQRYLIAYPIALLYSAFVLLTIF